MKLKYMNIEYITVRIKQLISFFTLLISCISNPNMHAQDSNTPQKNGAHQENISQTVYELIDSESNLRQGPGASYGIIRQSMKGESGVCRETKNGWKKLQLNDGTNAWVHEQNLIVRKSSTERMPNNDNAEKIPEIENREVSRNDFEIADQALNDAYKNALNRLTANEQEKLKSEQKEWLKTNSGGIPFEKHSNRLNVINIIKERTIYLEKYVNKNSTVKSNAITFTPENTNHPTTFVTPQRSYAGDLWSISTANNGKYVCLNGSERTEIWSVKDNALIHSFHLPQGFTRLLPEKHVLINIGRKRYPTNLPATATGARNDSYSVLTGASLITQNHLFSVQLEMGNTDDNSPLQYHKSFKNGYFVSGDGSLAIGQFRDLGEDTRGFELCITPKISLMDGKAVFDSRSIENEKSLEYNTISSQSITKKILSQSMKPPIEVLKHEEKGESVYRTLSETEAVEEWGAVILDPDIFISTNQGQKVIGWEKNSQKWALPKLQNIQKGLDIAHKQGAIAVFEKDTIFIAYTSNLKTIKIKVPNSIIMAVTFSPASDKIAVISQDADTDSNRSVDSETKKTVYRGTVFDLPIGNVLENKIIDLKIDEESRPSEFDFRWIESGIFLSGFAKFDNQFNLVSSISGSFFPSNRIDPAVLVNTNTENISDADEANGNQSQKSAKIIDPSTLKQVGNLAYSYVTPNPSFPANPLFDLSSCRKNLAIGWMYWRDLSGGIKIAGWSGSRFTDHELILPIDLVDDYMPVFISFLDSETLLALYPHNNYRIRAVIIKRYNKNSQTAGFKAGQTNCSVESFIDIPMGYAYRMGNDGISFYGIEDGSKVVKYGIKNNKITPLLSFIIGENGMVVVNPDQEYTASAGTFRSVRFTRGLQSLPFEQFDLRLNRPDKILSELGAPEEALKLSRKIREKRLTRMGVTEEMLKPDFHVPEVEIVEDLPKTTKENNIDLKIRASDSKYALNRLKIYINSVPINGVDGELITKATSEGTIAENEPAKGTVEAFVNPNTLDKTVSIPLALGKNNIQVSVYNEAGAESLYANAEIFCDANRQKPKLFVVALGVSKYSNSEWNLNYAAKDANDIISKLRINANTDYGEVKELLLTDEDVTKKNFSRMENFLGDATIDDAVIMFIAGHGLLDHNYNYYFGTFDINFNKPETAGIAFDDFDDLLAKLPCLKKLLLIDTCHAGELDEEEKSILASSGGTSAQLEGGNGVSFRSIGTRGMSVKPIDAATGLSDWHERLQGLFVDLRRGSGSTILSSSAGAEYALESSDQQNGLFTFAVLESLDGKNGADKDGDGFVKISELTEHVKKRVSSLTKNKQTPNVRRINLYKDFNLTKVKQPK